MKYIICDRINIVFQIHVYMLLCGEQFMCERSCSSKEVWLTVSHIIPDAYIPKLEMVSALQRNKSNFYMKYLSVNAPEVFMDNQSIYIWETQDDNVLRITKTI